MKKIILFILVFLSLNLTSQTTDWVKSFGGVNSDKGISIGTDSLGFIYISGFYNSEATFGLLLFLMEIQALIKKILLLNWIQMEMCCGLFQVVINQVVVVMTEL